MKKKVEQKKEIIPIFKPELFWEYKKYESDITDKIDAFLTNFSNELKALIIPQKSFQDNYEIICQKIGVNAHPCLRKKIVEPSQFPSLKNNDYGDRYAVFLNHKIDLVTLKIFSFVSSVYKLQSLKISNNNLQHQADEIKRVLDKEEQLTTLYFQWNPLLQLQKRKDVFLSCVRPTLQHLILRDCKIGNLIVKDLLRKIRDNGQLRLKSLDFYGNEITSDLTVEISQFVQENKTVEFLGLSKNSLGTDEFLKKLFNAIGQVPLSEEEYEQHKLKQKARDQVIQRNKKRKKGAPEEPVPFVLEVKQGSAGKVYVKNTSLKILNLANNGIKDSSAGEIRKFIENNGKNLELFIESNKFTKTAKQTFKFYENVIC